MHLVLTGATGLVGSGVLYYILSMSPASAASKKLTRLSILSRRADIPLLNHPDRPRDNTFTRVQVIQHADFRSYPDELLSKLKPDKEDGKLGVIWALGISQTEVKSDAEYIEITKEYTLAAAKALSQSLTQLDDEVASRAASVTSATATATAVAAAASSTTNSRRSSEAQSNKDRKSSSPYTATPSPDERVIVTSPSISPASTTRARSRSRKRSKYQLNFIYVSGEGANHNPGLLTPLFSRVKGETEKELIQLMRDFTSSSTTEASTMPSPLDTKTSTSRNGSRRSTSSITRPGSTNDTSPALRVYVTRPAGVDPIHQKAVHELSKARMASRGIGYRALQATMLSLLRGGMLHDTWSPTEELGKVFVELAAGDGGPLDLNVDNENETDKGSENEGKNDGYHRRGNRDRRGRRAPSVVGTGVEGFEGRVVRNAGIRRLFAEL